jgi:hypothetical protein
MFYNYTETTKCNDINVSANNAALKMGCSGTTWYGCAGATVSQLKACTEFVMPQSCDGVQDMFWFGSLHCEWKLIVSGASHWTWRHTSKAARARSGRWSAVDDD